ncbi:amino acid transporter aATP11 [Angomonas deanei]|nr:amino acid transporter aATP11 [Angomonas deanei]|eukprot:EPY40970.1 amino acid transporter aATP11 [Angomonas deanei]
MTDPLDDDLNQMDEMYDVPQKNNNNEEVMGDLYLGDKLGNIDDAVDHAQLSIDKRDRERAEWVAVRRQPRNKLQKIVAYVIPYGGLLSSGLNLASSSIGAGIISLASAVETSGIIMAVIYMVIIGILTVYSFTLLGIAGKRTGIRNYEEIVEALMGKGGGLFLAFCLWFLSFFAEVSYALSLHDIMIQFLENSPNIPKYLRTTSGINLLTSMLWLVFMFPLCIPREINTLRYFSFVGISFIIFFVICMIIHASQGGLKHGIRGDLVLFQHGNKAVMGMANFIFSFICQLNCFEVYDEMYKPTVRRLTMGASIGVVLCFCLYFLSGFIGYCDFGPAVADKSVLKMYNPIAEPLMGVAYVGVMFKLCVGYGLHSIPVRDSIYYFAGTNVRRVPFHWHVVCVICFTTVSLICGLYIPRVNLVYGLVGGFSGGFIGFIFPAYMFMYTGDWTLQSVGWFHYFMTYLLLIVGVIAVVWGTAATIYGEVISH